MFDCLLIYLNTYLLMKILGAVYWPKSKLQKKKKKSKLQQMRKGISDLF